jgi:4-amino-4-deoxy-L-arabinose transferase-like glycosyltransferase
VGGAALYRRAAIEAMGGFQPFIKGEEGVAVCLGIRFAGYKVVRLPYRMSRHYCVPPQSLAYNLRRMRLNMYLGYGQLPRYYLGNGMFWTYLQERGGAFMPSLLGGLAGAIALLLTVFTHRPIFLVAWALLVVAVLVLVVVKKRSLPKALVTLFARVVVAASAVRGFLIRPRSPSEYPRDAEIVQVCFHRGGMLSPEQSG